MDGRKPPPASGPLVPQEGSKSASDATEVISFPVDDNMILFGRGKAYNNNPGNAKMRLVVAKYRDLYQAAKRGEKRRIVLKVHKELVDGGMKFLKQEEGIDGWIEADANEAITKLGHAIRCSKQSKRKTEEDSDAKPQATQMLVPTSEDPNAAALGEALQDNMSGVVQEGGSASLALSALTSSGTGFPSSVARGYQPIMGPTLPIERTPLLSLQRPPINMTGLQPLLSAASPLTLSPHPSMALNGLSAVEIYVLLERERQLQQAMLYEYILRDPNQR